MPKYLFEANYTQEGLKGAAGSITNPKTRALLTPEEIDEAAQTAVDYRPPGS